MSAFSVVGIDHVQVAVPPGVEARCRTFYVDLLGMAEIAKPASLAARGGIWVQAGAHALHCGVETAFQPARKAHPAFSVRSLDTLAQRLEGAGHSLTWDQEIPGARRFFAHDPFGNRLEFIEADY